MLNGFSFELENGLKLTQQGIFVQLVELVVGAFHFVGQHDVFDGRQRTVHNLLAVQNHVFDVGHVHAVESINAEVAEELLHGNHRVTSDCGFEFELLEVEKMF